MSETALLQLHNISKAFGGVQALKDVSLNVEPGEVHAVIGENGAGKSTLMKIIAGALQPDSGDIVFNGTRVEFSGPGDASELGIAIVYQEPVFFAQLSVVENFYLGEEITTRSGALDWAAMTEGAAAALQRMTLPASILNDTMDELSLGTQQLVLIARGIHKKAGLLILDELSGATQEELDTLVDIIAQSASAGAVRLDPRTVRRALRFSELEARDLMVPRHDVVGLEAGLPLDHMLDLARRAGHLRYPVYERDLDNVVGMLNLKDIVVEQPPGEVVIDADWREHVRPVVTLPETASIEAVVRAFKQDRQQFAILVDEFGTLAGVIPVADVADHLLGLPDGITRVRPWEFVVDGDTALAVVDDELQLALSPADDSYETVGGLVMAHTGDIPSVGDRVTVDGTEIIVLEMEGLRVGKVRITVTPVSEGRAEEPQSG